MIIYMYTRPSPSVPELIPNKKLFLGPCIDLIRERLFNKYKLNLEKTGGIDLSKKELIFIGITPKNQKETRRIIYIGSSIKGFTFEKAYSYYDIENQDNIKTFLVSPIIENRKFLGYRHRNEFHKFKGWWKNITRYHNIQEHHEYLRYFKKIDKDEILFKRNRWNTLNRDICFELKSIFYDNEGLLFNQNIIDLLKVILNRNDVELYAPFGLDKDDDPITRRGNGLKIEGKKAKELFNILENLI